jgi:uncharacterized alkaline shock family protein YloU
MGVEKNTSQKCDIKVQRWVDYGGSVRKIIEKCTNLTQQNLDALSFSWQFARPPFFLT